MSTAKTIQIPAPMETKQSSNQVDHQKCASLQETDKSPTSGLGCFTSIRPPSTLLLGEKPFARLLGDALHIKSLVPEYLIVTSNAAESFLETKVQGRLSSTRSSKGQPKPLGFHRQLPDRNSTPDFHRHDIELRSMLTCINGVDAMPPLHVSHVFTNHEFNNVWCMGGGMFPQGINCSQHGSETHARKRMS